MFMPISVVYQAVVGWFIMTMDWQFSFLGLVVYKPWRLYILCSSIINALCFLVLIFLPESPKFKLAMGKNDEALDILKRVYTLNTGKAKDVRIKRKQKIKQIKIIIFFFLNFARRHSRYKKSHWNRLVRI